MIPRYTRPEMATLWSDESKHAIWLEIELSACEAMEKLGTVPRGTASAVRANAELDPARIAEIEREVKHDVIAFLTNVTETAGEPARHLHKGLTSSDVLDTALSVQLVRATDMIAEALERLLAALAKRAREHAATPTIGRSHGIHAEPTTFGVKLAGHHAEFLRAKRRLATAREEIAVCAISGAVGTFANIDPAVEAHVAAELGLVPEAVSSQVIPRDRHAAYFAALGIIASSIERLATEVRHLQRTEVLEAEEFFSKGQKGSSAMPHKRNPILTENLTGLARLVRSAVMPAMENVALWHERDISHSSVERGIAPDATAHLHFALHRMAGVVEQLVVYPDRMLANLEQLGGLHNSQRVLLALIEAGATREDAYALVQRNAMKTWAGEGPFQSHLADDPDVSALLDADALGELFDLGYHLKHAEALVERGLKG